MVCSLGSGQMAAMATLLEAGPTSQTITDEVGRWKLAAQYIHREIREADEVNLIDEEDMHVFGLKPMTDPLNLVCCNSCKKPVKASQYAAHAEICKSLSSAEEVTPEPDGGTGHKKPPRKERKKPLTTYATASVGDPERSRKVDVRNTATSDSHLDERTQMTTSFTKEAKGRDYTNNSRVGSEKVSDNVGGYRTPRQIQDCCILAKGKSDVPAPLATKIFYSQRTHRLRSALSHLYYESSANDHVHDLVNMKLVQGSKTPSWSSSPNNFCHEKIDDRREKGCKSASSSVQESDEVLAQSSDIHFDESGRCPSAMNFSNQFPVNNVLEPRRTPVGTVGSNYLSSPYSFAGNSGKPLGTAQQRKGSVPVT